MSASTPPPRTFVGSRRRFTYLLAVAIVFAVGGVSMIASGSWFGWIVVVFAGLGLVILPASLWKPPKLELTDDGFRFTHILARQALQLQWGDCSEFSARRMTASNSLIIFDSQRTDHPRLQSANQALVGRSAGIMGNYSGIKPADLAELMNRYREAAIARDEA